MTNHEIAKRLMFVSETEDFSPPYRVLPEPPISCKWMDLKVERIVKALDAKDSLLSEQSKVMEELAVALNSMTDEYNHHCIEHQVNNECVVCKAKHSYHQYLEKR